MGKDGQVANSYIPRVAPFDLEDEAYFEIGEALVTEYLRCKKSRKTRIHFFSRIVAHR